MSLSLCGMIRYPSYTFYNEQTFYEGIKLLKASRAQINKMYALSDCAHCKLASICPGCPGHSMKEDETPYKCIEYYKNILLEKMNILNIRMPQP
jgi:radical SAM protein with 4Fe4S-binding SPASM domain